MKISINQVHRCITSCIDGGATKDECRDLLLNQEIEFNKTYINYRDIENLVTEYYFNESQLTNGLKIGG